jgi:uncharacterized protein (DUF1499 family)
VLVYILIVLVLLPLSLAVGAIWMNRAPLLADPGPFERLRVYLARNVVETAAGHPFPELRPRVFGLDAPELLRRAQRAIVALGWELVASEPDQGRVHAVVQTPLLRFRDDVWVMVEAVGQGESRIHLRSASRVGSADFGANLRHVREFYRTLEAAGTMARE